MTDIQTIRFRPLRRIKKTGKVVVASYIGWRKLMTADYDKFNLLVNDEYKKFPKDEFVYRNDGELLFWFKYNPADIPIYNSIPLESISDNVPKEHKYFHGTRWSGSDRIYYLAQGLDCDGVPTFSHCTADHVAGWHQNVEDFEPLTVETVVKWFGWFLYQLNNSYLQIGKK